MKIFIILPIIWSLLVLGDNNNNNSNNIPISKSISVSNNGIIFQKLGKINFISAFHNLVISFNSESIVNSGNNIINIMKKSRSLVNKDDHYLKSYYIIMIEKIMKEFNKTFNKFKRYINNNNYNSIYSNKKLDNIIDEIENNNTSDSSDEINIINSYISKVNISNDNLSKINQALYRANLTMKALIAHYTVDGNILYNMSRELVMSYTLTSFDFCLRDFREEIGQLLYKLDSILTTSKTSILIITPEYFKKFLVRLQDELIELLYPPTDTFIPEYYSICNSAVKKRGNILFFIIKIPIKSSYKYDFYNIHYMSVPIINLPGWSRKLSNAQNKNYLAISADHSKYTIIDNLKDSCTSSSLTSSKICSSSQQIQKMSPSITQDSCLLSAYSSTIETTDCNFTYEYNKMADFTVIENFWIGSIFKEKEYITKRCEGVIMSSQIYIKRGIVKIPISNNCTYIGESFILPYSETKGNNKPLSSAVETVLSPIMINFPPYVISKLFLNNENRVKYLTSNDINTFKNLYEETVSLSSSFINSKINFIFFIIIFVYIIILTCSVIYYYCLRMSMLSRRKQQQQEEQPTPQSPGTNSNSCCNSDHQWQVKKENNFRQNPQYFCQMQSSSSQPLPSSPPPVPLPIYEDGDAYVDMQRIRIK